MSPGVSLDQHMRTHPSSPPHPRPTLAAMLHRLPENKHSKFSNSMAPVQPEEQGSGRDRL
jgi:hypothetical protein